MTNNEAIKYFQAWRLMEIPGSEADKALQVAIVCIEACERRKQVLSIIRGLDKKIQREAEGRNGEPAD